MKRILITTVIACLSLAVFPISLEAGPGRYLPEPDSFPRSVRRVMKDFVSQAGSPDSLRLSEALARLYSLGYLEARTGSARGDTGRTALLPGPRYYWGEINYPADPFFRGTGPGLARLRGKPVNYPVWAAYREELVRDLENRGYPFASVRFDTLSLENHILTGRITLERNDYYVFDSLVVRGEARISDGFLRRYFSILPGTPYCENDVARIGSRLNSLSFLRGARPAELEFRPGKVDVYLYLEKRKSNRLNGILGILPGGEGNGRLRFTGQIDLHLENSLAAGEVIDFRWRRPEASTQELRTGFVLPYLLSYAGIDARLGLYRRDTSYLNLDGSIALRLQVKGGHSARLLYRSRRSSLISGAGTGDYRELSMDLYGLGIDLQAFDNPLNPGRGYRLAIELSAGSRQMPEAGEEPSARVNRFEGEVLGEYYRSLFPKLVLLLKDHSALMGHFGKSGPGARFYENELFVFGGSASMRGFDEDSYRLSAYSLNSLEWRYLYERNSNLYLFFDGAWFRDPLSHSGFLAGFGAGIRLSTRGGLLSLAWALGAEWGNPLVLRNARVHAGYVSRF